MCVNTIVFTSPIRRASHAAPRCDSAFSTRAPKKRSPITASLTPKRSKKKYDSSAVVRKPPPRLSSAKSEEIRQSSGASRARPAHARSDARRSTAGVSRAARSAAR